MRGSGEAMTAKMTAAKSGAVFKPRIRTWRVSQATFYRSGLNEPGTKEALDAEAKEILIKVGADRFLSSRLVGIQRVRPLADARGSESRVVLSRDRKGVGSGR